MATELENHTEQSLSGLVGGIVHDIQDLVEKQVRLARQDLESGIRKVKDASLMAGLGAGFLLPGVIVIAFMFALLVYWLASPSGADPAAIPLWGCFGIVGAIFCLIGGCLIYAGTSKVSSNNALPESVKALEENLEWKTNPISPK